MNDTIIKELIDEVNTIQRTVGKFGNQAKLTLSGTLLFINVHVDHIELSYDCGVWVTIDYH
jgi:hypothetical protein